MIHDDGKLTLEPVGERERTMCADDGLRPALHSASGHHLGRGKSGGWPPTPAWHGGRLVSLAAGDFQSPLR